MATDYEKKAAFAKFEALFIRELLSVLWDLLGKGALSTTYIVGDNLLKHIQKEMGLEVEGEEISDVLNELARIFIDEMGVARTFTIKQDGTEVLMEVEGCVFKKLIAIPLKERGVEPIGCPYLNIALAACRKNLQKKVRYSGGDIDTDKCVLRFSVIE